MIPCYPVRLCKSGIIEKPWQLCWYVPHRKRDGRLIWQKLVDWGLFSLGDIGPTVKRLGIRKHSIHNMLLTFVELYEWHQHADPELKLACDRVVAWMLENGVARAPTIAPDFRPSVMVPEDYYAL